jgi:beta-ureidopropionase
LKIASANNFDIKSYGFTAALEDIRKPKIVKIGAIQNSIVAPTTSPIQIQLRSLYEKIGNMIDAAGVDGVNVLCMQEAWSEIIFT